MNGLGLAPRYFWDDPSLRVTFNSTVPLSSVDVGSFTLSFATFLPFSEEVWIDLGGEPPIGWWERELAREVRRRRISTKLRALRWRVRHTIPAEAGRRLAHAARALRGDRCEFDR